MSVSNSEPASAPPPPAASPAAIVTALRADVIGHAEPKRMIALAVAQYRWRESSGLRPPRVVAAGPAGVGKRHLVRAAATAAGLPFASFPVSRLGAAARGNDFAVELLRVGAEDVVRERRGVVYLDDADVVTGEPALQTTLCCLLGDATEPTAVLDGELARVPTRSLMFVLGGEFAGLDKVIADRVGGGPTVGFAHAGRKQPAASRADRLEPADLIALGFSRELADLLAVRVLFRPLPADELADLLARAPGSPLRDAEREFDAAGVTLVADAEVRNRLVRRAGTQTALTDELAHLLEPLAFAAGEKAAAGHTKLTLAVDPDSADGIKATWSRSRSRPRPAAAEVAAQVIPAWMLPPRAPRAGRAGRKWASEADLAAYLNPPAAPHATTLPGCAVVVESAADGSRLAALSDRAFSIADVDRRRHMLVVGANGSGKTARVILPVLNADMADPGRAVVLIDAQMELTPMVFAMHKRYRPDAPFFYLNLTEPNRSLGWNPFHRVRTRTDATVIAHTIKSTVKEDSKDSPFFREQATKILARLIHALRRSDPAKCHPGHIQQAIDATGKGIRKIADAAHDTYLTELADLLGNSHHNTQTTIQELENFLRAWEHEAVAATTSRNEFDFDVLDGPVAPTVVVAIPEEMVDVLRPATACFVIEFLNYVMKRGRGTAGPIKRPISLVIDEFASAVGRLPDLAVRINTLRKRGLCLVAAVQSVRQIFTEYGSDQGRNLLGGFRTRVFVPPVEEGDAELAAEMSGFATVQRVGTSDGVTPNQVVPTREPVVSRDEANAVDVHPELGPRMTWLLPSAQPFQMYLPALYQNPAYAALTAATEYPPQRTIPLSADGTVLDSTGSPRLSESQARARLEELKPKLAWEHTTELAKAWWGAFETQNRSRLGLVVRLAEELVTRKASVNEFFLSFKQSGTDNIQANLAYLDFLRAKKAAVS